MASVGHSGCHPLALPRFHQFQLLGSYAVPRHFGRACCCASVYGTEPAPPRPPSRAFAHASAAFRLLWELRNLMDLRTLNLGPKRFPDPRFSGPYQHCRGMGSRSLLFQNLRACLSPLLTLGATVYVSAGGEDSCPGLSICLSCDLCVLSGSPSQRRAFPRCKTLRLLKSFIDFEQGSPRIMLLLLFPLAVTSRLPDSFPGLESVK